MEIDIISNDQNLFKAAIIFPNTGSFFRLFFLVEMEGYGPDTVPSNGGLNVVRIHMKALHENWVLIFLPLPVSAQMFGWVLHVLGELLKGARFAMLAWVVGTPLMIMGRPLDLGPVLPPLGLLLAKVRNCHSGSRILRSINSFFRTT